MKRRMEATSDRTIDNFGAPKSVDLWIPCSSETAIDGYWGSIVVWYSVEATELGCRWKTDRTGAGESFMLWRKINWLERHALYDNRLRFYIFFQAVSPFFYLQRRNCCLSLFPCDFLECSLGISGDVIFLAASFDAVFFAGYVLHALWVQDGEGTNPSLARGLKRNWQSITQRRVLTGRWSRFLEAAIRFNLEKKGNILPSSGPIKTGRKAQGKKNRTPVGTRFGIFKRKQELIDWLPVDWFSKEESKL